MQKMLPAFKVDSLAAVFDRRNLRILFCFKRLDQCNLGLSLDRFPTLRTRVARIIGRMTTRVAETESFHSTRLISVATGGWRSRPAVEERSNAFQLVTVGINQVARRELK